MSEDLGTEPQTLEAAAARDPVTGLPGRDVLHRLLDLAIERARRDDSALAVVVFDLDDFDDINVRLGWQAGDCVLVEVAKKIKQCLRPTDTLARFGADDFGILLEGMTYAGSTKVAERINAALKVPIRVLDRDIFIDASIGICVDYSGESTTEELLSNAGLALFTAKSTGKNRFEVYQPDMQDAVVARLELEADLHHAIENRELSVVYQPLIDLESGRIAALEALVRWTHGKRGPVPPNEFVPMAENAELMKDIGKLVLEQVCREAGRFQAAYPGEPLLDMTLNISSTELFAPPFVEEIRGVLERFDVKPESLMLEIDEEILMRDTAMAVSVLEQLKSVGFKLAIDNFGVGYSSLIYLQRFPIDAIKIDKQFLEGGITGKLQDSSLARLIVQLAKSLDLRIIAEGIERPEQLSDIRSMEFNAAQGYFFAEPLSPDEVMEFLQRGYALPGG